MRDIIWDDIDMLYSPPGTVIQNGDQIAITLSFDQPIGEINNSIIEQFFSASWTYPFKRRYVRPFIQSSFTREEYSIYTKFIIKRKNTETDEIRLVLQDTLDFLNTDYISVKGIKVEVCSGYDTGEGTKTGD